MRNTYLWAACLWTLFIVVTCLMNFNSFKTIDNSFYLPYKDKYVHFTYYLVFTLLWSLSVKVKDGLSAKKIRRNVFFSAVCFGIAIEVCQGLFTTARSADPTDAVANTLGSATAVLLLWLLQKRNKQIAIL